MCLLVSVEGLSYAFDALVLHIMLKQAYTPIINSCFPMKAHTIIPQD